MDVVATRKRARSPSPYPDTLTSPLEVLLKRRRQGEWDRSWEEEDEASSPLRWARDDSHGGHGHGWRAGSGPGYGHRHGDHAMDGDGDGDGIAGPSTGVGHTDASVSTLASTWRARGVEHRRSRAWERLQAPSGPSSQPTPDVASGSGLGSPPARVRTFARAESMPTHMFDQHHHLGHSRHNPSLTHPHPHAHAHADAHAAFAAHPQHPGAGPAPASIASAPMSSSPVRHRPPSSTPFRGPREGEWTPEERMREWGEYSSQNTLLHSLHLARLEALEQSPAPPMSRSASHDTPSVALSMTHGTPQATRPRSSSDASIGLPFPFATPGPAAPAGPNAWGQHQRTPLLTPGLVSSPYESSPGAALSPLRALHTPGSAFPPGPASAFPVPAPSPIHESAAVRASYEETNRLLAALNVARIQRRTWYSSSVAGSEDAMDAMDES